MSPSAGKFRRSVALAGSMILMAGAGHALWAAGGGSPLQVDSFVVEGDLVHVSIVNRADQTLGGTVVIRSGPFQVAAVPVTVVGGSKAFVQVRIAPTVAGPIEVGIIIDDGSPF